MKRTIGFLARLTGVGVAVATAAVLTAGSASATAVELTIQTDSGIPEKKTVHTGVGVDLNALGIQLDAGLGLGAGLGVGGDCGDIKGKTTAEVGTLLGLDLNVNALPSGTVVSCKVVDD